MPYINGTGRALPARIVPNEEIAEGLGLTPEQIYRSSGILQRHWAGVGETTSGLAAAALREALGNAGRAPADVDYLLFGTMTPDRFIPGSASAIQAEAGLREIACLDIRAACVNALYALQIARALVISGTARCVAICLAEIQSAFLDLSPAAGTLSMLFGDGAAALIVTNEHAAGALEILDVHLAADGIHADDLGLRGPGTEFGRQPENPADLFPRMNGQAVIIHAGRKIIAACNEILQRSNLNINDISWLVPHQANANLLTQIARNLKFTNPDGVISVIADTANTSSASMGLALHELQHTKRPNTGEYILLPAFGAGFTWGAGLCRAT